jgi:hypothetical protein
MPLTTTTRLQAVNTMLSVIGSAPVNQLTGPNAPNSADVAIAMQVLDEVSLNIQARGWHFNTEEDVTLTADPITSEVVVASNVLLVDVDYPNNDGLDITLRGNKLYNRKTNSFQFTGPVEKVRLIRALEWDDLPQAARHYITIRAARIFQDRVVGSEKHHGFTQQDELIALSNLKKYEGEVADHSIFDNYDVYRVIDRRYPYQI